MVAVIQIDYELRSPTAGLQPATLSSRLSTGSMRTKAASMTKGCVPSRKQAKRCLIRALLAQRPVDRAFPTRVRPQDKKPSLKACATLTAPATSPLPASNAAAKPFAFASAFSAPKPEP